MVKTISIHLIRKCFLSFKLFTAASQEKSSLPNSLTIFPHGYWRNTLAYSICHIIDICYFKTPDLFFWLILVVISPPSLTTMRFSHNLLMNTSLGESSKFPMTSLSMSSTSSSTITTFSEGLPSWMKPWFF